jgi:curved DNA-binding protein CbpA
MEKYFKILKLKPGASLEDVKRAYKTQVKIWHPDRFPQESPRLQKKAHEMFQKVTTPTKKLMLK